MRLQFLRMPAILAILLIHPLTGQKITSLAILDFDARGIAVHEAASLTDWLRSEIVKLGEVPLVERGDMLGIIIAEQDLQSLDCTSDVCAVEIGQILGVSHIVTGSMGKVGSTYTILARVIDVETGQVIRTPSRRYQGAIDGLFDEMTPVAYGIIGKRIAPVRTQTASVAKPPVIKATPPLTNKPPQKPVESKDSPGVIGWIGASILLFGVRTGSSEAVGLGLIILVVANIAAL